LIHAIRTHQLSNTWVLKMNIQALTLANKCTTVRSEVDNLLLANLPNCLIDGFDVVGDPGNLLDRSVVSNNQVLHLIVPELQVHEFT